MPTTNQIPKSMSRFKPKSKKRNKNKTKSRKALLVACGLPDIPETAHCFADATHHTCCQLGTQAREYADASGNPIGQLSVDVSRRYTKKTNSEIKAKKDLKSWCTCTGSGVCSYYASRFGSSDGTHIKFIGNLATKNEQLAIRQINLMRHQTPGIPTTSKTNTRNSKNRNVNS